MSVFELYGFHANKRRDLLLSHLMLLMTHYNLRESKVALIHFTLYVCNGHASPANNGTEKSPSWEANGLLSWSISYALFRARDGSSL